jgi:hypothetical protein
MRPIDKFILHVVHNLLPLNEYSQGVLDKIMAHYREEADDLNISITDNQLKSYIERFDQIKTGIIQKGGTDLIKIGAGGKVEVIVPLSQLIRLISSRKAAGEEVPEEIDITPDVVYHNDNNTIVIYNGSKEANCINYGEGEKWCITRSSFSSYRYSEGRAYPTFYLAKNNNLPTSDPLSFVAIQVRDPQQTDESNRYVYTNRKNSPYESDSMSFERLLSEIPWLREVPNIKSVLKYIPLSSQEKITQQYGRSPLSYREWTKLPYPVKEQYLVVRKGYKELFSDISNQEFVEKYLPKYPELTKFIAETPGIIDQDILLKNLDKFPNQIRRSITSNIQRLISTSDLPSESFSFDIKKLLVQLNKWSLEPNERLYITKDGSTIVKLTLGDDIKVGLYQAEDDYPNIKLNKRTSKYLLDYPELDKIPLKNLLKLAENEVIDKDLITRVLNNAKEDPNSAIIIKPVEGGNIILDSNSFTSYKMDDSGKISSLPFNDEEVQQVFNDSKDNETFQQNALNLFKASRIPDTVDKDALLNVINSIPYNQRIVTDSNNRPLVLLTSNGPVAFFGMEANARTPQNYLSTYINYTDRNNNDWRRKNTYGQMLDNEMIQSYFAYLRQINKAFNDNELLSIMRSSGFASGPTKKAFIQNNPPVDANNVYKAVMNGDDALLINTQNPKQSFMLSSSRNNLKQANISSALAAQLLGQQQAPAQPAAGDQTPRRGRPAGVPNAPRQQQAEPAAAGDINVRDVMEETGLETAFLRLPRSVIGRLNVRNASRVNPNNDRGASRRNNILGNAGRVGRVIQIGASKIYFIRLANQQVVASINIQPGNSNYLLTGNANGNVAVSLDSPSQLLQALQQRNLAEIHNYLVNEYMERNPNHLSEFRQLLRQHINEKKKRNEQK